MARFTFSDAATTTATFNDVVTDSETTATWYRLWTGNAAGDEGNWVDTGSFNDYGDGWIDKNDLDKLDIDYLQEGDTELWIQPWNSSEGSGDWAHGAVDFSTATDADITTNINADTAMDQMFTNDDATTDTWYNLWIGNAAGDNGSFVDTGHHQGWVQAANLGDYDFTTEDAGNDLWVETWTPEDGSLGWDHWSVTTSAISGNTYTLTAAPDTLTGTANNDQFNALEDGDLSVDDTLDGGGGTDSLIVRNLVGDTGKFTSTSIENIDVRADNGAAGGSGTVDLSNATGVTNLDSNATVDPLTFNNIDSPDVVLSLENNVTASTTTFTFKDAALTGTNSVTLNLTSNTANQSVNIDNASADGNVIETLNVVGAASTSGSVITLLGSADAADTVDISGTGVIDISGATLSGTTIDASDVTDTASEVNVALGNEDQTITGSAGNDYFDFDDGNNDRLDKNDTVDGGKGTDSLAIAQQSGSIIDGTANGNVSNVSNIETLVNDHATITAAVTLDFSQLSSLENATFNEADTQDLTLTKTPDGATISLGDGDGAASDEFGTISIGMATNTGTQDITLALDSADVGNGDELKIANGFLDQVSITVSNANSDLENLGNFDIDTLNISNSTGTGNLDLSAVADGTLNPISASIDDINASSFKGDLLVRTSNTGTEIDSGSGADQIIGGSGADIFSSGAGNDTIYGGGAVDDITTGAGNDKVVYEANAFGATDTINDFTSNDMFYVDFTDTGVSTGNVAAPSASNNKIITSGAAGSDSGGLNGAKTVFNIFTTGQTSAFQTLALGGGKTVGNATVNTGPVTLASAQQLFTGYSAKSKLVSAITSVAKSVAGNNSSAGGIAFGTTTGNNKLYLIRIQDSNTAGKAAGDVSFITNTIATIGTSFSFDDLAIF